MKVALALILLALAGLSFSATQNVSSCENLTVAGDYYTLNTSVSGAPNNASGLGAPYAACIRIDASNITFDCAGYNVTNDGTAGNTTGIHAGVLLSNVTVKNCDVSGYTIGIGLAADFNSTVINNTVHNSTYGIAAFNPGTGPANHTLTGNTVYNDTLGFALFLSSSNTMLDNAAYGSGTGFFSYGGGNNTYGNCTSRDNSFAGYLIQNSTTNIFANSTVYNNTAGGFYIDTDSDGNYLVNNSAFNHTGSAGFILHSTGWNTYVNNTAYNNNAGFGGGGTGVSGNAFVNNSAYANTYGFSLDGFANTSLAGNIVHDNNVTGVSIGDSTGTVIAGDHYYNNGADYNGADFALRMPSTTGSINLSGVIFDNPAGDFRNFTNLSINDSIGLDESYSINWTSQPSNPHPFGFSSVNGTFVSIEERSGTVSIDAIVWQWDDSLIGGHDEARFELWRYGSSGWTGLNNSPDTSMNTLGFTDMGPGSVYAVLEAGDCRDGDGDGAPYSYVPGACVGMTEDCDDNDKYLVPPYAGLRLDDANSVYTLCSGTYAISTPSPPPILIEIGDYNITLDCNGAEIINDGQGIVVYGGSGQMRVKNCVISECMYGVNFYWGDGTAIHNNSITNCSYGLDVGNTPDADIHGNGIYDAAYGIVLGGTYNSSIHGNTVNSSLFGYSASNQYINYSGQLFDDGRGMTYFVPSDVFVTGGEGCEISADGQGLNACAAFDGTEDLSVFLADLSPLSFGSNATIIMNETFAGCPDVDAWWDTYLGMHPPCYLACVLYAANGAGNDYALNESCYNSTANVSGGLTYPPYIRYGAVAAYGILLEHSAENLIYNNIFATASPASDTNNGYFQDYFASFSPFTLNGQEYNGSAWPDKSPHAIFLHNTYNGEMGASDSVGSDDTILNPENMDGSHSYGMFAANFSVPGQEQYLTVYFDTTQLSWTSCADVESSLYNMLGAGDCHAFCPNILTSNGPAQDYTFDDSCLNVTFNVSGGYTYPPYLRYQNYSVPLNMWNTVQQPGPNIIGGQDIGGNFYPDYNGTDTDGDGIGEVPYYGIAYPPGGAAAVDYLPLTNQQSANPPPPDGDEKRYFSINASQLCPGDNADVYAYTSEGPLPEADVRAILSEPYGGLVSQGQTDSSGHITFHLVSNGTYEFQASKSGYEKPDSYRLSFVLCEEPGQNVTPPPQPPPEPSAAPPADAAQPPQNQTPPQQQDVDIAPPPQPPEQGPSTPSTPSAVPAGQPGGGPDCLPLAVLGILLLIALAAGAYAMLGRKKES